MTGSEPPLLPSTSAPLVFSAKRGATSLPAVFKGLLMLELFAWKRSGVWVKAGLALAGLIVITRLSVSRGNAALFSTWMIDVVTLKLVPLLCLVTGGGLLRNQIRSFTIEYLWTRPASKTYLVLSAWAVSVVLVSVQATVATVVVHAVGSLQGVPNVWDGMMLQALTQVLIILPFCALAVALGVVSGKYMVLGLVYGLLIEGGMSRLPTNLNRISVTHHAEELLSLSASSVQNPMTSVWLPSVGGLAMITGVALALAVFIFNRTQYSVGGEKEG
ncbi:MAG TPA: hypothetical protein PLN52_06970 [Opitutaceae bacterium]|nr:hypothetical protein [Opitutaceae bacterium]